MNENDKEAEVVRCVQEVRNSHQTKSQLMNFYGFCWIGVVSRAKMHSKTQQSTVIAFIGGVACKAHMHHLTAKIGLLSLTFMTAPIACA